MIRKLVLVSALAAPLSAHACSVCIAHSLGAAIHGFGAQTLHGRHGVVGITYLTFSKSNAAHHDEEEEGPAHEAREFETFQQTSIEASYGLNSSVMATVSVPFVHKSIRMDDGPTEKASGMGDIVLGLTIQLPVVEKNKVVTAFEFDLKLPSGQNDKRDSEGARLEDHLQPGSGTTDVAFGLLFSMEDETRPGNIWFGGVKYRANQENKFGFKYGNVLFYNLGYAMQVTGKGTLSAELVGRFAGKDRENGLDDEDSGGHLNYAALSYNHKLSDKTALTASVQVPFMKGLYGDQTERAVFFVSVSGRF
ncbi:MAG: transporter [Armatimonadetes bacterium]|nr:transporter [Armatimonadota bacterium]